MNLSKAALALLSFAVTAPRKPGVWCSAFLAAAPAGAAAGRPNRGRLFLFDRLFSASSGTSTTGSKKLPVLAEESVMSEKAHGTSDRPVQKDLRWKCDYETADRICNYNRHYAEVRALPA
jgi:hypothetical protein